MNVVKYLFCKIFLPQPADGGGPGGGAEHRWHHLRLLLGHGTPQVGEIVWVNQKLQVIEVLVFLCICCQNYVKNMKDLKKI